MASWKRKAQKAQGENNDTKLLLEEQNSRNTLLEKKQRKFDAEINSLNEDLKSESTAKDRLHRDLDELKRMKFSFEDQIQVSGYRSSSSSSPRGSICGFGEFGSAEIPF